MFAYRYRKITVLAFSAVALSAAATGCSKTKAADTTVAAADTTAAAAAAPSGGGAKFDQALHDALPAAMKKAGVMTLATDPTDPPLEFYNEKNELVGAEVDLAAALGFVLGVKVNLVPSKFDAIIPGVEAGRFDGSVSGFADRKERQKLVDLLTTSIHHVVT